MSDIKFYASGYNSVTNLTKSNASVDANTLFISSDQLSASPAISVVHIGEVDQSTYQPSQNTCSVDIRSGINGNSASISYASNLDLIEPSINQTYFNINADGPNGLIEFADDLFIRDAIAGQGFLTPDYVGANTVLLDSGASLPDTSSITSSNRTVYVDGGSNPKGLLVDGRILNTGQRVYIAAGEFTYPGYSQPFPGYTPGTTLQYRGAANGGAVNTIGLTVGNNGALFTNNTGRNLTLNVTYHCTIEMMAPYYLGAWTKSSYYAWIAHSNGRMYGQSSQYKYQDPISQNDQANALKGTAIIQLAQGESFTIFFQNYNAWDTGTSVYHEAIHVNQDFNGTSNYTSGWLNVYEM